MRHPQRAWNRQHHRTALEKPCDRHLPRRGRVRLRDASDDTIRLRQLAGGERKPGNEPDAVGRAMGEHVLAAAVDQVVAILDCRHRKHALGGLDIVHGDLAQPCVANDTLVQ